MKQNWADTLRNNLHELAESLGNLLAEAFHYLALFAIGAITAWAAVVAFLDMVAKARRASTTSCCCSSTWSWVPWLASTSRPTTCRCAF